MRRHLCLGLVSIFGLALAALPTEAQVVIRAPFVRVNVGPSPAPNYVVALPAQPNGGGKGQPGIPVMPPAPIVSTPAPVIPIASG